MGNRSRRVLGDRRRNSGATIKANGTKNAHILKSLRGRVITRKGNKNLPVTKRRQVRRRQLETVRASCWEKAEKKKTPNPKSKIHKICRALHNLLPRLLFEKKGIRDDHLKRRCRSKATRNIRGNRLLTIWGRKRAGEHEARANTKRAKKIQEAPPSRGIGQGPKGFVREVGKAVSVV